MRLFPALLAAGALAAVALPAAAQEAPANSGPYFIMDISDANVILAAGGSRARQGSIANVTVSVVSAPSAIQDGIARLDMAYSFQCGRNTFKTPGAAAYDVDGGFMGAVDDDQDWTAINPGAVSETIMQYACDGKLPDGVEAIDADIDEVAARYRELSAGE